MIANEQSQATSVSVRKIISTRVKRGINFDRKGTTDELPIFQIFPQTDEIHTSTTKVVFIKSSGDISVRTPAMKKRQRLLKNIVLKNWKAVSNAVLADDDMLPYVLETFGEKVSAEFKYLCGPADSCLKHTTFEELSCYTNKVLVQEAKVYCPFWYHAVCGAARVNKAKRKECQSGFESRKQKATNRIALATATLANFRNPLMFALAKRISIILMHSGAKSQDFTRLQHLGISTSHKDLIRIQKSFSNNHDSKVVIWKERVESHQKALMLLQEIKSKQLSPPRVKDDDMDVDITVDFRDIKSYKFFTEEGQRQLSEMFYEIRSLSNDMDDKEVTEKMEAILSEKSPPSYRYAILY